MSGDLSYDANISKVVGVQFSIMSAEDIRARSVCEINSTDTYSNDIPKHGGLFDPRLGVVESHKKCVTCGYDNKLCPGHFGHIELAKPVFNSVFIDYVRKILKCVCFNCSKLLVDPKHPDIKRIIDKNASRIKRFDTIFKICDKLKGIGCGAHQEHKTGGCLSIQPNKIEKNMQMGTIIMTWKDADLDKLELYAEDVLRILKRMTMSDVEILGFTYRPENMIFQVFPFPPTSIRPSVTDPMGRRSSPDDLTVKLCDIIKQNNRIAERISKGATTDSLKLDLMMLQYHVSTFARNDIPSMNKSQARSGRSFRVILDRIKGKDGLVRGNLVAKRVDFSARSVITPDPNLDVDELGVPLDIAMNITFRERVNKYNRDRLLQYVLNGPKKYPGAKKIIRGNKSFAIINGANFLEKMGELRDGDIIHRHLINGDYVLFNRQPSLHKMSMMGHRVRVMPYNTFRLNVMVTPNYNADKPHCSQQEA